MSQFKFELESQSGLLLRQQIIEPVGWDTNKPVLTRDEFYGGVMRSFTVDLVFIKNGFDYLKTLYDTEGILSNCLIYIYEHNNSTHEYELQDIGKIDFTTWDPRSLENGVSLTITDTGFAERLRAREDTEVNYNDNVDLDENTMSEPIYVNQEIFGAEVISRGSIDIIEETVSFEIALPGAPPGTFWLPGNDYEGQVITGKPVASRFVNASTGFIDKETDAFFIAEANGSITIAGSLNFDMIVDNGVNVPLNSYVRLVRGLEAGGSVVLKQWTSSGSGIYIDEILDISGTYNVDQGDYIYIITRNGDETSVVFNKGIITMRSIEISLIQKDQADPTVSKGVLLYDCFNRTIESITGVQNSLVSDVLKDGEYKDFTLQNGLLIRNYTPEEAALSFKFKDLFENINKIFNIGLSIKSNNTVEIKKLKDFFKNGVIHTVTRADMVADSFSKPIDTDYYYSDIEVGYAKSAYEEISGLEEYNNKSYFNTIISVLNNKLDLISKYRGDIYAFEFARRLQKNDETTKDSKYDVDLMLLNVINEGEGYKQLTTEGFTNITGIDQISTPGNLSITPGRNLRRWGWMLSVGLQKYIDSNVKFNKSDFKSDLSTTYNNLTVSESESVPYSSLDAPVFTGHRILFEAKLNLSDYKKLKDNPNQLIKVWNPTERQYNFGWIKEVSVESVDKSTNFELIEAKEVIEVLKFWLTNSGGAWLWNDGTGILLNNQS